mgnify:CR=1 FL=1
MPKKRDDQERIERALDPNTGLTSEMMDTNSVVKSVSSAKTDSKAGGAVIGDRDGGESLVALDNPDDADTYLNPGGDRARKTRGGPGVRS